MASKPGPLTEWPWQKLGSYKYVVLAPCALHTPYLTVTKEWRDLDWTYLIILPYMLLRIAHNQIWISLACFQNARRKHRIVDKGLEFEQVDRESNWDDQIILNVILFYLAYMVFPQAKCLPFWRTDGTVIIALLYMGPVEFLYYWLHRALHHHFLFSRYHSSIVTEPITSVIHPFAEHLAYFLLFAIPMSTTVFTGTASVLAFFSYIAYLDFMNNMGHCNFEMVPQWMFHAFPPLKYLMYTPS